MSAQNGKCPARGVVCECDARTERGAHPVPGPGEIRKKNMSDQSGCAWGRRRGSGRGRWRERGRGRQRHPYIMTKYSKQNTRQI